jgi:RNA polymerase sigma-70 factor (ECF subfamily)
MRKTHKTERDSGLTTLPLAMTQASFPLPAQEDVIARAQAGDEQAFEHLYRENLGRVYALCLRMTGDRTDAEELTQEAFVRAWKKLGSFRGESAFSTWLHRLTVNLVLTEFRTRSRRRERVALTDDLSRHDMPAPSNAPRERVDLEQAIAALPEGARHVFVLYEIEGYKHDEIADMMGIASGTTKAQLHRARKLLREALT